jgi:hypothetical protein
MIHATPHLASIRSIPAARLARALAAAAVLLGSAGTAAAQNAADKAAAEQLFKEARTLMGDKKYAEACPKLEASLRLDPALGTRLNLASCYEESGKLASAWGMYHEAADLALNENQPKRVKFAQDHAKALEPRLPKLIITVAAPEPGLKVTRDGTVIDAALFGTPIYVDPGQRAIAASAPGYKAFSLEVTALEGKETKVEVPALAAEPQAEPAVTTPSAPGGATRVVETEEMPVRDPGKTRRLGGLIAGASGLAVAGVGLGFGLSARSKWNEANDGLCTDNVCTPEGQELADAARSRATISTVMVAAGAALVVTGAVLYLTAPRAERRTARLIPSAGKDTAGLALVGQF